MAKTFTHTVPARRPRRPFAVTLLAVLVLTIAALFLLRLVQAIAWWDFLAGLPEISPLYLVLTGLLWSLAGLPLAWGLWRGYAGAPRAARLLALAFTGYFWLERIWLANPDGTMANWPFSAAASAILLALVFWILARPGVKAFFGERDEQFL